MAGYTAMGRIDRAAPHFRSARGHDADAAERPAVDVAELPLDARPAIVDDGQGGFGADLIELLSDIRDVWRQGREVLADPQGWR